MSAEGNEVARKIIAQTFDDTSHAFIDAICESLPHIPRTEIVWRGHFLLGALYYTLVTTGTRFAPVARRRRWFRSRKRDRAAGAGNGSLDAGGRT